MFETLVSFTMIEHLCGSIFDPPLGPPEYPRVTSEARRPYRTRHGYNGVMIYKAKHCRDLFAALRAPEQSRAPIFASIRSRTAHHGAVLDTRAQAGDHEPTDEWQQLMVQTWNRATQPP